MILHSGEHALQSLATSLGEMQFLVEESDRKEIDRKENE
jgi:hypothetical protein